MKNTLTLLCSTLLIVLTFSCKKEGCTDETANNFDTEAKTDNGTCTYDPVVATLTTNSITAIGINTATSGGTITNTGTHTIKVVGLCWSTNPNPTLNDDKTTHFYSDNSFSSTMEGLTENTTYYVRAYATSDAGTAYGDEKTFTTIQIGLPTITTNAVNLVTTSSVTTGGNITDDGFGTITERGICWGTSPNPTISGSHTADNVADVGSFTLNIGNLLSETTYYFRAYATNSAGTAYGQEITYVNPHISFIGEYYQGGVVFYIDNTGEHGLICSIEDQSYGAQWGCSGNSILTNDPSGSVNTSNIVANCNDIGIAATLCINYTYNGFNGWYLPSLGEFNYLNGNLSIINTASQNNGGNAISTTNIYWSSTEYDLTNSWANNFSNGGSNSFSDKTTNYYVRAIRAF